MENNVTKTTRPERADYFNLMARPQVIYEKINPAP